MSAVSGQRGVDHGQLYRALEDVDDRRPGWTTPSTSSVGDRVRYID